MVNEKIHFCRNCAGITLTRSYNFCGYKTATEIAIEVNTTYQQEHLFVYLGSIKWSNKINL